MRKRATLSSELPLGAVLKDLAYALFGGLTPLLVSWLVHFDRIVPAHYVAAATIVGLAAMLVAPSHRLSDPNTSPHLDESCV